jgi:cyclopropane-fatty-acyl-phospholipid synthase
MEQVTTPGIGERIMIPRVRSLSERVFLKTLGGMRHGHVQLTLPSGEVLAIGDPSSTVRASLHVVREDLYRKVMLYADIGFAEAYIDGDWETDNLSNLLKLMLLNLEDLPLSGSKRRFTSLNLLKVVNRLIHRFRSNSRRGSQANISEHYDLSNSFFALWLDPTMMYSSARFARPDMTLEEAQVEKVDRLCRKLRLQPGDRVLEIGSGWGGFAVHAAKRYAARVTTVTISKEQYAAAVERVAREGVADLVEVKLQDYRSITGTYDKLVSIEMLEAVGHEYLEAYFRKCQEVLTKDGLMAFQVITSPDSRYDEFRKGVDFIQKHIFPGSLLPSIAAMITAVRKTGPMHLFDLEDFGLDYARTLAAWKAQFNARLDEVRSLGFGERFIRKWNYYLSYCEAGFSMRNISVVQMVFTGPNNARLR